MWAAANLPIGNAMLKIAKWKQIKQEIRKFHEISLNNSIQCIPIPCMAGQLGTAGVCPWAWSVGFFLTDGLPIHRLSAHLQCASIAMCPKIAGEWMFIPKNMVIIEGSLEVKLPTIWTDEKQSREEAERRERLEERRVEEKEQEERRCRCAKR